MSSSTRQHYVPQFLLRHFAPEQHPSQVWTYDKRVGAGRLQSIRDSGHENRFYEHEGLRRRGVNLEATLAEFESCVAPFIAACVQQHSLGFVGPLEKAAILDFALVQLFRTRAAREFAKAGSEQVLGKKITEKDAQEMSFAVLLRDFPRYRACCESHVVTLREAQEGERFLLGDGVTLIAAMAPSASFRSAIKGAVIMVPLCPTLCIMLFPSRFQSDLEFAGAWYRPEIGVLDEAQPTAPGDVDSANAMSVFTSNRFVFSSTGDFTDVELLLRANPASTKGPVGNRDELSWPSCD